MKSLLLCFGLGFVLGLPAHAAESATRDYKRCVKTSKFYHAEVSYSSAQIGGEPTSVVDCTFPGAEIPGNNPGLNLQDFGGWVRIKMSKAQCLSRFMLIPAMYPPGDYLLKIHLEDDAGQEVFAETFGLYWPDQAAYQFSLPQTMCGIRSVQFETLQDPSWTGWYEMRAY